MFVLGDYRVAAALAERAAHLQPDDFWSLYFASRAAAAFDRARSTTNSALCLRRVEARLAVDQNDARALNMQGPLLATLGRPDEATHAIELQSDRETTLQVYDAIAFAMIGQVNEAIAAIKFLAERGWVHDAWLRAEPAFQSLHGERRFESALSLMQAA